MIVIAPLGNPMRVAEKLAAEGHDIEVSPEGRYLRAYPTTIATEPQ